jgi:hypothetical protein
MLEKVTHFTLFVKYYLDEENMEIDEACERS